MRNAATDFAQPATAATGLDAAAGSVRRHELLLFFGATFGLTWGLAALIFFVPDFLAGIFGEFSTSSPIYFLAVYAPSLVALVLTVTRQGWRMGLTLLGTLRPRMAHLTYYLAVLLGWPVLDSVALLVQSAMTSETTTSLDFSRWYAAPMVLLVTLVADAGPLGEEVGWRGYALPRLLAGRLSPLVASLVLGLIWGLWHLPAFFVSGTAQHDLQMGILWLLVGTMLLSVIMTWLYRRTGGDVLASGVLVHLMNNLTLAHLPFVDLAYAPLAIVAGIALMRQKHLARSDVP